MNTFNELADSSVLNNVSKNLVANGFLVEVVGTKEEALEKIKSLVTPGSSVMNGASKTLEQIGFVDYLKSGKHGWENLHEGILMETNPEEQALLRKQSTLSDFYLGSVHALSETGEIIVASNTGSQLPHVVYSSPNVIFVVGTQKIVSTLDEGMKRLEEYVFPLEDQRIKDVGYGGSQISKIVILKKENPFMKRKVTVLLVKESLGF